MNPPSRTALVLALARASSLIALAALANVTLQRPWPGSFSASALVASAHYMFLFVALGLTIAAWLAPGPGGALLVLMGAGTGVAASNEYSWKTSLAAAVSFVLPGVLFLSLWLRGRRQGVQALVSAGLVLLLVFAGIEGWSRHRAEFGPAHPQSPLRSLPIDRVEWMWAGAVTPDGFEVRAKLTLDSDAARLVASTSPDFAGPMYSSYGQASARRNGRVVALGIKGLQPSTTYYYAVEVDGRLDAYERGQINTFPLSAASFTVAFGSCARTGSNGAVFDTIRGVSPLLFIHLGDLHYMDIDVNDRGKFRAAYDRVLTAPAQAALYRSVPVAYIWDDHDYGPNNSDASSASRPAARLSYRENVPHYELPAGDGNNAIYQAFSIGRVRFIMTDTRSERGSEPASSGQGKSMLGRQQLAWFEQELFSASRSHSLVVWVNPDPWIAKGDFKGDDWGAYAGERQEIADFIAANGISNLVMISGDAHMIAIDDGSNSDYSESKQAAFPVFHAAALDRQGSFKGGPYSEGAFPGAGQFGLLSIEDDGGAAIRVTMRGMDYTGREVLSYSFSAGR